MILSQLEKDCPDLLAYTKTMPPDLRNRCTIRKHPPGGIIHQKNMELSYFGIVAKGENRVINEFENGNVYMIEGNHAIDFIGEVTILAKMPCTSVTIEAVTENIVVYMRREDAEKWLSQDLHILGLVANHIARKLYRSSYNNGAKLFYPPSYLVLDFLIKYSRVMKIAPDQTLLIQRTRPQLQEEIGVNVKTLNRTIKQLKEADYFSVVKGKIAFSYEHYLKAVDYLDSHSS